MTSSLRALGLLLTDVTTLATMATAVATVAYSAYRANESLLKPRDSASRETPTLSEQLVDENVRVLEGPLALALPIFATISIILLFFFLGSIGVILTALSTVSGAFSIFFVLWPLGGFLVRKMRAAGLPVRGGGLGESLIIGPLAIAVIGYWLFTGHWLANNIIGVSLCIVFAVLCRVPNLKVTTMLFAGLFVYDIFFVFFSERFFGRNVMVEVATSTPVNPAAAIANFLHLPISPIKNLALPAKLMFPAAHNRFAMLGLGDIILPEVLLVYLLEFDLKNKVTPLYAGFFARALPAYAFGLLASFFCNFAFGAAQPALLYIVPSMLLTTVLFAKSRGQLLQLWNNPTQPGGSTMSESTPIETNEGSSYFTPKEHENVALLD